MPRVILLIVDGLGIGELPDASFYNDEGSNTLKNLSYAVGGIYLPCLEALGLGNLGDFKGINKNKAPLASYGAISELSKGKDSITGHWEMMGIMTETPFPTYPHGFPEKIIKEFEKRIGRKTLYNKPASGTEIIKELGDKHMKTGYPIIYTSADSVFQIAAHEEIIPPHELYRFCKLAREILKPPHNVSRVIARPFVGPPFKRTPRRKDFSISPPEETALDLLVKAKIKTISVGKVIDMFAGRGFSKAIKAENNKEAMSKIKDTLKRLSSGLIFSTLTDFDTLYGHRNDPQGFANALNELDTWLSGLISELNERDYLFITADHGNDPTTESTDHSREYVPVLFYNRLLPPKDLGIRNGFMDIGATIINIFGLKGFKGGSSFFL